MRERLAGYLTVLGLAASEGTARLVAGQFHDVVLAGEVAYRFPRDEEFALLQALPAARSNDQASLDDGLCQYR